MIPVPGFSGYFASVDGLIHGPKGRPLAGDCKRALAAAHGVSWQTIHDIMTRRTWPWLEDTEGAQNE